MRSLMFTCLLVVTLTACADRTTDTEAIITELQEAWLDGDPARLASLYAEDGVLANIAVPFERTGRSSIESMLRGHLLATDYTMVDLRSITLTDTGAVVEWIWEGTYLDEPFSIEASTTFEIEYGLIARSADSYNIAKAPWR